MPLQSQNQLGFDGGIYYKDGAQLDAFGRLRVSNPKTLFDSHNEFGLDTENIWDATANGVLIARGYNGSVANVGNSVGPVNADTRMCPITVTATNGEYAILQSAYYCQYQPGKSHLAIVTGVLAAGAGYTASFVLRSKVSGAVVDTEILQQDWNVDKMDGTGASGITLDLTKIQILMIDAQMLYAGRIRFGFDIGGTLYYAHEIYVANTLSERSLQLYDLPVRLEGRTSLATTSFLSGYFDANNGVFLKTTRATKGGTIQFSCANVTSEGGEESAGLERTAALTTAATTTTRRPILSIRPKATFNGYRNSVIVTVREAIVRAVNNDAFFEFVAGGTLTGAAFSSISASSTCEVDTSATAISGGTVVSSGFAEASSASKGAPFVYAINDRFWMYQIDALAATQTAFSVVATSTGGTSNTTAVINFNERIT
jgi:hypothetical protein